MQRLYTTSEPAWWPACLLLCVCDCHWPTAVTPCGQNLQKKFSGLPHNCCPEPSANSKQFHFTFTIIKIKSIILLTSSDRPKSEPTLLFFLVNWFNYILLINLIVNEKTVWTGGCVIQLEWNARPSGSFFSFFFSFFHFRKNQFWKKSIEQCRGTDFSSCMQNFLHFLKILYSPSYFLML